MKNMKWLIFVVFTVFCVIALGVACQDDDDDDDAVDDDQTDDDTSPDDDAADDDGVDDDQADDDVADDDQTDDDIADDDLSDEVWTDSISGLRWQNGDACGFSWEQAKAYCGNLSWGGFSDWRLPTVSELRSLIRGCENTATGGACGVTDDCLAYMSCWNPPCNGCAYFGGPGPGGRYWPAELAGDGWIFWSSFQVDENPDTAWRVHFYNGLVSYNDADYSYCARCVR